MAKRKGVLKFPSSAPTPPSHVSGAQRRIWTMVVRDLVDTRVKLSPAGGLYIEQFCSNVHLLAQVRRDLHRSFEQGRVKKLVRLESDTIKTICEVAGYILLPHSRLGRYLTGQYAKREPPPADIDALRANPRACLDRIQELTSGRTPRRSKPPKSPKS